MGVQSVIPSSGLPVSFSQPGAPAILKIIRQELSATAFTAATQALRKVQLKPGVANLMYVPVHVSLDVKIGSAFTNNTSNIVLTQMADPTTGSEGDLAQDLAVRGDGALSTVGRYVHYQSNPMALNVGSNQVGITQAGNPLWFLVRNAPLAGGGSITRAILTVIYYEVECTP